MNWKATWKYMPVNYNTDIGIVEDITQRTVFRNNLNGEKVKLKFSNRYGKVPLTLERVVIAEQSGTDGGMKNQVAVTKDGNERI